MIKDINGNDNVFLTSVSCFLGKKESEVDEMLYFGDSLFKGGRQCLDDTMTCVSYTAIGKDVSTGFMVIFDTDYNGTAVIQKTTWGDDTCEMYNRIFKELDYGVRTAVSDGFVHYAQELGNLLIELQKVGNMDFVAVNMDGTY